MERLVPSSVDWVGSNLRNVKLASTCSIESPFSRLFPFSQSQGSVGKCWWWEPPVTGSQSNQACPTPNSHQLLTFIHQPTLFKLHDCWKQSCIHSKMILKALEMLVQYKMKLQNKDRFELQIVFLKPLMVMVGTCLKYTPIQREKTHKCLWWCTSTRRRIRRNNFVVELITQVVRIWRQPCMRWESVVRIYQPAWMVGLVSKVFPFTSELLKRYNNIHLNAMLSLSSCNIYIYPFFPHPLGWGIIRNWKCSISCVMEITLYVSRFIRHRGGCSSFRIHGPTKAWCEDFVVLRIIVSWHYCCCCCCC